MPASPVLSFRLPEMLQLGQLPPTCNCVHVTRCRLGKPSVTPEPFGQQVQQFCCDKAPAAVVLNVWPVPPAAHVLVCDRGGMGAPCPAWTGPWGKLVAVELVQPGQGSRVLGSHTAAHSLAAHGAVAVQGLRGLGLRPQSQQHPLAGQLVLPAEHCTDRGGINADTTLRLGPSSPGTSPCRTQLSSQPSPPYPSQPQAAESFTKTPFALAQHD